MAPKKSKPRQAPRPKLPRNYSLPDLSPSDPILDRHKGGTAELKAMAALVDAMTIKPKEVIRPYADPDTLVRESQYLSDSLRLFLPAAWHLVEPRKFVPNWHIDALAEHLEAVTAGDIKDLLITMPPRHTKSLTVSVLWPAWEWTKIPYYRWVFASYAFSLSVRDSVKRRNVLMSKWYQERWGHEFSLIRDQNTKIRYQNDKGGFMLASSVGGTNTGEGGERIIADDPHNIKKAESEEVRTDTVHWWNVVMSTRRNDEEVSARVAIQQRAHEADVAGSIIEHGGYVHLNLQARFEPKARCFTAWTEKATGLEHKWEDPRVEDGEVLSPGQFSDTALKRLELELGDYQWAAQFQQNPAPPQGTIIKSEWLRYYGGPTGVQIPEWGKGTNPLMPILSVDCAFKKHEDTDFVAGLAWEQFGADIYLLPICIHERLSFTGTVDAIAQFVGGESLDQTDRWPGIYPFIKIKLVEEKANGSAVIDTLRHRIPGMVAYDPKSSSKESRLMAGSWRFRSGNVYLPHESIAPWIKEYVYELCAFPRARRDDYVDATSQLLLWVGGDPQATGDPAMGVSTQESRWLRMVDNDMADVSTWAGMGGGPPKSGTTSVWRRHG